MADDGTAGQRVIVDGKFLRQGPAKFYLKGVTYGPFGPDAGHGHFANPEQTARDFRQICGLGANTLRVYYVPPRWLLDLAAQHSLKLLIDIPWPKHLCFLDSADLQREARATVRHAATECCGHPAVLAYSVVNEVPADIVRWSGARPVESFIEELVEEAKAADPGCLCTYTNFPSTEFLRPANIDFLSFNVYLHERRPFENYLGHLQMLADSKPLVLAEFGLDSIREGEARQSEFLSWQIEAAFRGGLAGTVVFSFTDDWYRGGMQIEDWAFGLTTRDRQPKRAFRVVQQAFATAPHFPLARTPHVSVVVASYNGGRTLDACLESLQVLNYPDYEVILVDDGSTDNTPDIAARFPTVRTLRQENRGLSAARNAGIAAARGEIVAFTDSDCRADEDWLYHLVSGLLAGGFAGIGGHNFLPPEDSPVAAAVMVSPGGPAHVMLTDREAEHIPGCNMAFHKWALQEIGGFDPIFRKAGDDVDVCWRVQQHGYQLGFSAAGFVWHYRRSTIKDYLKQQAGYGEAEALLTRKHPEYFNSIGRGIWRGRIYSASRFGVVLERSIIYHGIFGSGPFQRLYSPAPSFGLMLCTTLEYHALVTLPLLALSAAFQALWILGLTALGLSLTVCGVAAMQANLAPDKRRWWSRPLVALLFFLQPLERGLARYRTRLHDRSAARAGAEAASWMKSPVIGERAEGMSYWSKGDVDRYRFLGAAQDRLVKDGWEVRADSGWTEHDLEIMGSRWSRLRLVTASEDLDQNRRNIRCRLEPHWSLFAKVIFWVIAGLALIVISLLSPAQPWIWMLALALPVLTWFLEHDQTNLALAVVQILDHVAGKLGMVKLPAKAESHPPAPASNPART